MKIFIFFSMILSSQLTLAESTCQKKAREATMMEALKTSSVWEVENVYCSSAKNLKVIICQVLGTNGDGSGDREYRTIISKDCKKIYRIDLIGEE